MLTVKKIQEKVIAVPKTYSTEKLLNELLLMYKVEKGLQDIEEKKEKDWEVFKKEMRSWSKSK
jgi:hypothetical protein